MTAQTGAGVANMSCKGIMVIPEHSSHALKEMPSVGSSWCKVYSTCAWHTHHLSPMREINSWQAQRKLPTGLWTPEYLIMYLFMKHVWEWYFGSYSSVTARHTCRYHVRNQAVPIMRYLAYVYFFFFSRLTLYSSYNENFMFLFAQWGISWNFMQIFFS